MTKYRPSNGTEGMLFYEQWCGRCEHDRVFRETQERGCSILADAFLYDEDDERYPSAWHLDAGTPRCSAFCPELTEAQKWAESHAAREAAGQQVLFQVGNVSE